MKTHLKIILSLVLLMVLGLSQYACKATDNLNGHHGSTSAQFTKSTNLSFNFASTAHGLLFGKFTTDSYPDMIFLSNSGADYYKNVSGASWAAASTIASGNFTAGIAANLDADSNNLSDLVLYDGSSQLYPFLNGAPGGSFTVQAGFALTASSVQSLAYISKSAAGTGLIAIGGGGVQHSWVSQSSGTITIASEVPANTSSVTPETGVKVLSGDINGDGKTDFVLIPRTGSNPIEFWIQNAGGTSFDLNGVTISPASANTIQDAVLADMDGDGKLDIVLATDNGLALYLNTSTDSTHLSFATSTKLSAFTSDYNSLAVADFTGDGKLDIFASTTASTGQFITQSGTLTFTNITSTAFPKSDLASAPSHVYGVDLNNDGNVDLVELKSDGTVTVHLNNG